MAPKLDRSIASHAAPNDGQVEQYSRYFSAPASDSLGKRITVAILAESANERGSQDSTQIAVQSIQQYFETHTTTNVPEAIKAAIAAANSAVLEKRGQTPDMSGLGVAVAVAAIGADRLFLGSVGRVATYLIREGDVKRISAERTWVRQARDSWQVSPTELHDHTVVAQDYLGKSESVAPDISPVEFLWPGDTVLLLSAPLAGRLRIEHIRDIVETKSLDQAAASLVDAGMQQGPDRNLTAMLIRVPGRAGAPIAGTRRGLSPAAKGLLFGNALLICLVLALLARRGGLADILKPQPTVEVARPMFIPTPMADVPDASVPNVDPFAQTPVSQAPAAAPSVTPVATFTPQPLPPGFKNPPAPDPVLPANGALFSGPSAAIILAWNSVGTLPDDMFYVVSIRKFVDGKFIGESRNWTKATRIRLDSSFYASSGDGKVAGLAAQQQQATVAQFEWNVAVFRLTIINPNGTLDGQPISATSPTAMFLWGPPLQQAPTRVYGGDALNTQPSFDTRQARSTNP